jgi:O-antigen/teichoic acid export membrane protein
MHSAGACAALGAACAASAGWWLYANRRDFLIRRTHVLAVTKQDWRLGSWLFASQMTSLVQGYVPLWILVSTQGAAAAGIYAACLSVASVAKPLISGLGNVLMPRSVAALRENGVDGLCRQVIRDACLLCSAMALVCVAALLGGNAAMIQLYHGQEYIGTGPVVSALAVALLASAAGIPASNALASIEHPSPIFWAGFLAAASTALVTSFLVGWGPLGAAWGLAIGNAIGASARWAAFVALAGRSDGGATSTIAAADARMLQQPLLSAKVQLAERDRKQMQVSQPPWKVTG